MRKLTAVFLALSIIMSGFISVMIVTSPAADAVSLTPNVKVNDDGFSSQKSGIDVMMHDSGRTIVVWGEERYDNSDIFLSYSPNNGTSFSPDYRVNNIREGRQSSPSAASGDNNEIYVVWQDDREGNKIYLGKSLDWGRTFLDEVKLSNNDFGLEGRPTVAVNGQNVTVAWEDEGSENSIRIWNPDTGAVIQTLNGHDGAVRDADFSPDDSRLITGSEDNSYIIWDTNTWTQVNRSYDHTNYVTTVEWSPDGNRFASGSWDGTVQIRNSDLSLYKVLDEIDNIKTANPVNDVTFSPNGSQIAVAYNGIEVLPPTGVPTGSPNSYYNVTVWNTTDWSNFTRYEGVGGGHKKSVYAVEFSHDGTLLASGSKGYTSQYTIKVWDTTNGAPVAEFTNLGDVNDLAWSPDDRYIAAALGNGTVAVFNYTDFSEIYWLEGQTGRVNSIDWNEARNEFITGASDPKAKIWDAAARTPVRNLGGHLNSVHAVDWATGGNMVVTAGGNSKLKNLNEIQIYSTVSTDGGATFSNVTPVGDTLEGEKRSPRIAIDKSNVISVVWYDDRNGGDDVFFSNSTDMGVTFSDDIGISATLGKIENLPRIDVEDDGTVHVVWQWQKNTAPSPRHNIYYANSSDNFAGSRAISPTIDAVQQTPDMEVTPDGSQIYVTWIDSRDGGYQVFVTNSSDGGLTFDDYTVVNDEFTNSKWNPAIGVDEYGQIGIAWDDMRDEGRNIYYSDNVLADTTPPIILSYSPEDGSTNVSIFAPVEFQFSEPMDRNSVENAFSYTDGSTVYTIDDSDILWSEYGDFIRFVPKTPFEYLSTYTVTVAVGPKDIASNFMVSGLNWTFTTGNDFDPPVIDDDILVRVANTTFSVTSDNDFTAGYDEEVTITATIKDFHGTVNSVKIYYMNDTAYYLESEMTPVAPAAYDYTSTIPAQWMIGNVSFYFRANDIVGNTGESGIYNYSTIDEKEPVINHKNIKEWFVGDPMTVSATVEDFADMNVTLFYKNADDLAYEELEMLMTRGIGDYAAVIPGRTDIGVLKYYITATDIYNNTGTTNITSVNIIDIELPVIILKEPENMENKDILITANVTDNLKVDEVDIYFKAVGSDIWVNRPMSNINGSDEYSFTITAQTKSGTIYYYVNATDTSGNTASTLDDVQGFPHEWQAVGTRFDWTPYILAIVIAAVAAIAISVLNPKKRKPKEDDEWLGPIGVVAPGATEAVELPKESSEEPAELSEEPAELSDKPVDEKVPKKKKLKKKIRDPVE